VQQKLQEKPPANNNEEEWAYIKDIISSAQDVIGEKQTEKIRNGMTKSAEKQ
jgi:hypothetical protein